MQKLADGPVPDYVNLSGSGEPTLNERIGQLTGEIKMLTYIPVAVLTNSSLLWQREVQDALMEADLVLPSLDAGDEGTICIHRRLIGVHYVPTSPFPTGFKAAVTAIPPWHIT